MGLHRQCRDGHVEGRARTAVRGQPGAPGIGWVPDDRGIYARLTVAENLLLPPVVHETPGPSTRCMRSFPVLQERKDFPGTKLSGGEQQMLAIAGSCGWAPGAAARRAERGLAPVIVQRIGEIIREINGHGVAVLLVEQNVHLRLHRRRPATSCSRRDGWSSGSTTTSFAQRKGELLDYLGL
jgi:branched-chain amino acid transport system ATP-binding protein